MGTTQELLPWRRSLPKSGWSASSTALVRGRSRRRALRGDHPSTEISPRGSTCATGSSADASCAACNTRKADYALADLKATLVDVSDPAWDGLLRLFAPLWEAAGETGLCARRLAPSV